MRAWLLAAAALLPGMAWAGTVSNPPAASVTMAQIQAAAAPLIGAKNGIAGLDGNGLLPSDSLPAVPAAKLPVGVAGGVAAYGDSRIVNALPAATAGTGTVADIFGGAGRTLAQAASDTYNLANHGADGTAANDSAAFAGALTYAAAHPGTRILWPSSLGLPGGVWNLTAPSTGFQIPTETTVAGIDQSQAVIQWTNDIGSTAPNLFTTAGGSAGTYADIKVENLTVRGTWDPTTTSLPASGQYEGNAFFLIGVNDVSIEHVTSENQRYFGMSVRASVGVKIADDIVRWTGTDGINLDDDSDISVTDNIVQHNADDCISAHSDTQDTWGARRIVHITGNRCFDNQGVRVLAARDTLIAGNMFDTVAQQAINVETVTPNGASYQEGTSSTAIVEISGNTMANLINRTNVDNENSGVNAILIDGYSAQKGSLAAIPGENDATSTDATYGTVIDPYKEFMGNSTASTVAIGGSHTISIVGNVIARLFPATNNADPRFASWNSLKQGTIASKLGAKNPTLAEGDIESTCFNLEGGYGYDIRITGNTCSGQNQGLAVQGNGHWSSIVASENTFFDFSGNALFYYPSGRSDLQFTNNFINGDPFFKSPARKKVTAGSNNSAFDGTWSSNAAPVAIYNPAGAAGLTFAYNTIRNVSVTFATNANTGTCNAVGDYFHDNVEQANLTPGANYFSATGQGIGDVADCGFRYQQWDSNPQDAAYDTALSAPNEAAYNAIPTTGYWLQGEVVRNQYPAGVDPVLAWVRLTAGSGEANGTDWLEIHSAKAYLPLAGGQITGGLVVNGSISSGAFVKGALSTGITAGAITSAATTTSPAVGPTALTAQQNVIAVCASGNAVALPAATGYEVTVRNETGNACLLEPQSGANFGVNGVAGTTNASISIPAYGTVRVLEASGTQDWQ